MQENAVMSNGVHHEVPEFLGPKRMINRQEYIRLLEQSLHRLGFAAAAQQLERDSVIPLFQMLGASVMPLFLWASLVCRAAD